MQEEALRNMLFHSYQFLFVFLPLVFVVFQMIVSKSRVFAMIAILVGSLYFYSQTYLAHLSIFCSSILINFLIISQIIARPRKIKVILMWSGIALNLALLGFFKYSDFFKSVSNDWFNTQFTYFSLVLPLAISFYTFQQMSLIIDALKRREKINPLEYAAYVSFFPQLIAGPIVRFNELECQFKNLSLVSWQNISRGVVLVIIGVFKKVIISDKLLKGGEWVDKAVVSQSSVSFVDGWIASFAYSFKIYFDFSAYTDMALGLAFLFGIRLPLNFNSPYKASSIQDFWRRWHMTLSRFIRDYIYVPLGGNRKSLIVQFLAIFVAFFLGGLWHGAGWNFVLWGLLHCVLLIFNIVLRDPLKVFPHRLKVTFTFVIVSLSWVVFRVESIDAIGDYFIVLLNPLAEGAFEFRYLKDSWSLIVSLVVLFPVVFLFPNSHSIASYSEEIDFHTLKGRVFSRTGAIVLAGMFCIAVIYMTEIEEFIYFRF